MWGTDLSGGILLEEPYQTRAYGTDGVASQQAPDRFLNLTYLMSPSPTTSPFSRPIQTMPALDPQDAYAAAMMEDRVQFNTQRVASHGTLKRMRLQKCPTDGEIYLSAGDLVGHRSHASPQGPGQVVSKPVPNQGASHSGENGETLNPPCCRKGY